MKTSRVIGLDPGGTTGWSMYTAQVDSAGIYSSSEKYAFGHMGPEEHHDELFSFLESMVVDELVVVCESFEFRQGKQRANINLMSKEYIGVVKLFRQQRGIPVVFQTAGLAKPFVTDAKLKAMGLYQPGWKHANDATRHMITYMVQKQGRVDLIQSWRNL